MKRHLSVLAVAFGVWVNAATAAAATITFTGADAGAASADPRPSSDAVANTFAAAVAPLGAVSVIDFESASLSTYSSLDLGGGVTLTGTDYTGSTSGQSIRNSPAGIPDNLNGYNTTFGGSNFAFVNGGSITFSFASPIQGFGAYLSGIQFAGETISYSDGTDTWSVAIPHLTSGGIAFVGFTDVGRLITSVTINTTSAGAPFGDFIGVDDVRFVSADAVAPEPASLTLVGLALAGLAVQRRRNRQA